MSLNNTKAKQAQRGFTIVELLIVIVVIGILAAITLVSYNGITSRANAASAKATAATVQKKAELYQADGPTGKYPFVATDFTTDTTASYYMSATNPNWSFAASTGTLSNTNGTNTVVIRKCGSGSPASQSVIDTAAEITGLQIYYYDYNNSIVTTTPVTVGTVSGTGIACPTS